MAEVTTQEIATIPVEDFKALAEAAPIALQKNTEMLEKAKALGNELKEIISSRPMDDDLDQAINDHMVKLGKGKEVAFGRRSPFTRIIQGAVSVFTSIERFFDTEKLYFQMVRDEYAKEKIRQKKEAEAVAARKLAIDKERVEVKSRLELEIQQNLLRSIETAKGELTRNFNIITLENFDKAALWFEKKTFEYTIEVFDAMPFNTGSNLLSADEVIALSKEVRQGKFDSFKKRFESDCNELLTTLRDRLVGKKKELEEIAAKEAEAIRLQAAAKSKAEKEAAERSRIEGERLKAEAEARKRQEEQEQAAAAERAQREAAEKVELEKEVEMTNTLFDHEANNAVASADAPEGREGYEITVVQPAGYVELFQFWWKHEGSKLGVNEVMALEKKTLKQMKTFAEKQAHKNPSLKIESKFLVYSETFKTQVKK